MANHGIQRHPEIESLIAVLLCVFVTGCGSPNPAEEFARLQKLASAGDLEGAKTQALKISSEDPLWADAQFVLGDMEFQSGRMESAVQYFDKIPRNGSWVSLQAAERSANYYLNSCQLSLAIDNFEYVVQQTPDDSKLRSNLATMLVVCGQRTRADRHLMHLLQFGRIELKDLVMLTQPNREPPEASLLIRCASNEFNDPATGYALLAREFAHEPSKTAMDRLRKLVTASPRLPEPQALLGEALLDGSEADFAAWQKQLPKPVLDHPHVWYVLGMWSRRHGNNEVAIRCFWETIRKDPLHDRAMYQLGQVLAPIDAAASSRFQHRAALLREGSLLTESVLISLGADIEKFVRFIEILTETGRLWEAWAWTSALGNEISRSKLPEQVAKSLSGVKGSNLPRFADDANLARLYDSTTLRLYDSTTIRTIQPLRRTCREHLRIP